MLNHRTLIENTWLDNVMDTIQHDNDNFKPCIATLKFDKSVPFIYNLHDNIPPFNYMDENHRKMEAENMLLDAPFSFDSEYSIGGEMFDDDPVLPTDTIPPDSPHNII